MSHSKNLIISSISAVQPTKNLHIGLLDLRPRNLDRLRDLLLQLVLEIRVVAEDTPVHEPRITLRFGGALAFAAES